MSEHEIRQLDQEYGRVEDRKQERLARTRITECLLDGSDCGHPACPEKHDSETCKDQHCSHPACKLQKTVDDACAEIDKLRESNREMRKALARIQAMMENWSASAVTEKEMEEALGVAHIAAAAIKGGQQ